MKDETEIPVGAKVIYREDGAECLCQVLASETRNGYLCLKLVALENGTEGRISGIILRGIPEGRIFDVDKLLSIGNAYGMWTVKEVEEGGKA